MPKAIQEPISCRYYNRHTGREEYESIYGEGWLRWAYQHPLGRLTMWALGRRALASWVFGLWMSHPLSRRQIRPFIQKYSIPEHEFAKKTAEFRSFNDFFCRCLRPEARPIEQDPRTIVFPADGRHRGYANSFEVPEFFMKGEVCKLEQLCGSMKVASQFMGGAVVISRLCPTDYHRFHFCAEGIPSVPVELPGLLDSVHPIALRENATILWRNRRMMTIVNDLTGHPCYCQIEIGAAFVGSIRQTYCAEKFVRKGDEKGYFEFGGSCVITLFPPGTAILAEDLLRHTQAAQELYAHFGSPLGRWNR